MKRICLHGPSGSGKDTLVKHLQETGLKVTHGKFASFLRPMAYAFYGRTWDPKETQDDRKQKEREDGFTQKLIEYAGLVKWYCPDFFALSGVYLAEKEALKSESDLIVFSDLRAPQEYTLTTVLGYSYGKLNFSKLPPEAMDNLLRGYRVPWFYEGPEDSYPIVTDFLDALGKVAPSDPIYPQVLQSLKIRVQEQLIHLKEYRVFDSGGILDIMESTNQEESRCT